MYAETTPLIASFDTHATTQKAMGLWTSAILNRIKDNKNERPKYPQKAFSIFLDEVSRLIAAFWSVDFVVQSNTMKNRIRKTAKNCRQSTISRNNNKKPLLFISFRINRFTPYRYFIGSIVSVGELAPQSCIMAVVSRYFYFERRKRNIWLVGVHSSNQRKIVSRFSLTKRLAGSVYVVKTTVENVDTFTHTIGDECC